MDLLAVSATSLVSSRPVSARQRLLAGPSAAVTSFSSLNATPSEEPLTAQKAMTSLKQCRMDDILNVPTVEQHRILLLDADEPVGHILMLTRIIQAYKSVSSVTP